MGIRIGADVGGTFTDIVMQLDTERSAAPVSRNALGRTATPFAAQL